MRLPSARAGVVLATLTLAIGVVLGAAIGPAPAPSFAGGASDLARRLPLLIASIRAAQAAAPSSTASTASTRPPAVTPEATPKAVPAAKPSTTAAAKPEEAASEEEAPAKKGSKTGTKETKLPAVTNIWLIELDGTSFEEAEAQPTATPYITETLLPAATLLKGWSALQASAFASEAALAEPPAAGAVPPLLHSIVQPPCPEGAAGAGCAAGTPGQLAERRSVPEGRAHADHLDRDLPRTRVDRRHLHERRAGRPSPNCPPEARPRRSHTGHRRAPSCSRPSPRPASARRSPSIPLHPGRASKSSCTDEDRTDNPNAPTKRRPCCTHHIQPTESPRSGWSR